MNIITIQPKERPDGKLPYPYFIDESGGVGRQDFWKGHPKKLIGFSEEATAGSLTVLLGEFLVEPQKAVGLYPVFSKHKGGWFTQMVAIESVSVEEKE